MSRVIRANGYNVISSDIRHTGYGVGGVDFLQSAYPDVEAIIMNPPFDYAEQFIRRALMRAPKVAALLKVNFWSAAGRAKLWDDCTPTGRHDLTWRLAFLKEERGDSPLMDVCWFLWDKSKPPLKDRPLTRPSWVPDISVQPLLVRLMDASNARRRSTEVLDGRGK